MPPRNRGGGQLGGIRVTAKIDAEKATREFKEARRDLNARVREGLRLAGEKVALPQAKRNIGSGTTASTLVVRSTTRAAFLTTSLRGKQARYVGLLEFGGTVRGVIRPKTKRAVVVNGQPVANVTTPRRYRPRLFMTRAVEQTQGRLDDVVRDEIMRAFDGLEHD